MSKTIIIGGNYRGGTSATAKVVMAAGVYLGEGMDYNEEDKEFQSLFHGKEQGKIDTGELKRLIRERNAAHDVWGFKYPAIHFYILPYIEYFRNPHFIFILRDPYAVARSEQQRHKYNGFDFKAILKRTIGFNHNMIEVAEILKEDYPVHLLSFERLLTRTEETIRELLEFTGLEGDPEELAKIIRLQEVPV